MRYCQQVRDARDEQEQLEALHRLDEECVHLQRAGNYLKAFDCMERALVLRRHFFGVDSPEVIHACRALAEMCNLLSMSFLQQDNFAVTIELLKKAEILSQHHHPKEKATTLNNLACYYRRLGKLHTAMTCLKKALAIERKTLHDPRNAADTHLNICAVLSQLGKHQQALDNAQAALLTLQEEFFKKPKQDAGDSCGGEAKPAEEEDASVQLDRVSVMCIAYHNMGVEQEFLKDYESCVLSYKKGVGLAEQYLGVDHAIATTIRNSYLAAKRTISTTVIKTSKGTTARTGAAASAAAAHSPRSSTPPPSLRLPSPVTKQKTVHQQHQQRQQLPSPRSIIADALARGNTLPPLEVSSKKGLLSPRDPFFSPRFRFESGGEKKEKEQPLVVDVPAVDVEEVVEEKLLDSHEREESDSKPTKTEEERGREDEGQDTTMVLAQPEAFTTDQTNGDGQELPDESELPPNGLLMGGDSGQPPAIEPSSTDGNVAGEVEVQSPSIDSEPHQCHADELVDENALETTEPVGENGQSAVEEPEPLPWVSAPTQPVSNPPLVLSDPLEDPPSMSPVDDDNEQLGSQTPRNGGDDAHAVDLQAATPMDMVSLATSEQSVEKSTEVDRTDIEAPPNDPTQQRDNDQQHHQDQVVASDGELPLHDTQNGDDVALYDDGATPFEASSVVEPEEAQAYEQAIVHDESLSGLQAPQVDPASWEAHQPSGNGDDGVVVYETDTHEYQTDAAVTEDHQYDAAFGQSEDTQAVEYHYDKHATAGGGGDAYDQQEAIQAVDESESQTQVYAGGTEYAASATEWPVSTETTDAAAYSYEAYDYQNGGSGSGESTGQQHQQHDDVGDCPQDYDYNYELTTAHDQLTADQWTGSDADETHQHYDHDAAIAAETAAPADPLETGIE